MHQPTVALPPELKLPLRQVMESSFREDVGCGDLSSALFDRKRRSRGEFIAKAEGVVAGLAAIGEGYRLIDETVDVQLTCADGQRVEAGDRIAVVTGPISVLLTGERVILNLIQHLSGIATSAAIAVNALKGSRSRICDTRKTLPGLRALQKYAVRCGGGYNHRYGLDGGVMIKDNHIAATGSIQAAVERARQIIGPMTKIEVECESDEQVREAIRAGADIIMLDNRSPEEVKQIRTMIPEHIKVELSGGITPETIADYRDCEADFISMGSLTHSVRALDISFLLDGVEKASMNSSRNR